MNVTIIRERTILDATHASEGHLIDLVAVITHPRGIESYRQIYQVRLSGRTALLYDGGRCGGESATEDWEAVQTVPKLNAYLKRAQG